MNHGSYTTATAGSALRALRASVLQPGTLLQLLQPQHAIPPLIVPVPAALKYVPVFPPVMIAVLLMLADVATRRECGQALLHLETEGERRGTLVCSILIAHNLLLQ